MNALLKKDMKTEKLREFCVDQLDVFLGKGALFLFSPIKVLASFAETREFVDRLFDVVTTNKYMPESEEKEQQTDEKVKEPKSSREEKRSSKRVKDDEEVKSPKSSRYEEKASESSRHEDKKLRALSPRTDSSVDNTSMRESGAKRSKNDDETKSSKGSRHDKSQTKDTYVEERSPKKSHRHEEESLKKQEKEKSSVLPPGVDAVDSGVHSFDDEVKKRKSDGEMKTSTPSQGEGEATKSAKIHIKRPRITPPDFDTPIGTPLFSTCDLEKFSSFL